MYQAIVTRIQVRPHPNADKLQVGVVGWSEVVVGLDVKNDELGVFFPTDGALSHEFCVKNDLYPRFDESGQRVGGGFIDPKNRRVRAQTFRGQKSFGFWVPASYFDYTGAALVEGMEFTELNGFAICEKYVNPATVHAAKEKANRANVRRETTMFLRHLETGQLSRNVGKIHPGALVTITEKLHGTSFRVGRVLDRRDIKWYERLVSRFVKVQRQEWRYLQGSRNVILELSKGTGGYYGSEAFRYIATAPLYDRLHPGEVVYGEIVGWVNETTPIMPTVDTAQLGDKAFSKQYGKKMTYTYGCLPGQAKIFVYRIVQMSEDGYSVELSWQQVRTRCAELGVATVPHFCAFFHDGSDSKIKGIVEPLMEGPSTLDTRHIREGAVVRVDGADGTAFYKAKSYNFYVLEGVQKSQGTADIEESS